MKNNMESRSEIGTAISNISRSAGGVNSLIEIMRSNQATGGKNYEKNIDKIKELDEKLKAIDEELTSFIRP